MRLRSLRVQGFRGLVNPVQFDLDADAIVVIGKNGLGKTCLLDAVLWGLTGAVPRLGESAKVISAYSKSGEARVSLELARPSGDPLSIDRVAGPSGQMLSVSLGNDKLHGDAARVRLMQELWPEALLTTDSFAALLKAVTRSVYLQQDLVREFIESDNDQERFTIISEIVGTGRISELHAELDRARRAWSQATNLIAKELDEKRKALQSLETALDRLSSGPASPDDLEKEWSQWWTTSRDLGVKVDVIPATVALQAAAVLDQAIKQLEAMNLANDRKLASTKDVLNEILRNDPGQLPNEESAQRPCDEARRLLNEVRTALSTAQDRAAAERANLLSLSDAREEVRSLAQLALRHLGEKCPVCMQTYDEVATRRRLEELVGAPAIDLTTLQAASEVQDLSTKLERAERTFNAADVELKRVQQVLQRHRAWKTGIDRRLKELGLEENTPGRSQIEVLQLMVRDVATIIETTAAHRQNGERIALRLARASEQARRSELAIQIDQVRQEAQGQERLLLLRERTSATANQLLETIQEATSDFVEVELKRIEPLVQRIFSTIDPHPTFQIVNLLSTFSYRRGRITTQISDRVTGYRSDTPAALLSSSQLNALAVSIFLALNLGVTNPPLRTTLLDDPLQSLDDVNLLGVVDLLRRASEFRQIFVTTHDDRFGHLLERKLRPIGKDRRTRVIEFLGWTREGPEIIERDVPVDTGGLRIAA